MGTNYYINRPPSCGGKCAEHCHGEQIHLGKSFAGWDFSFQAYPESWPEAGITWAVTDFASWERLLDLGQIYDEYGNPERPKDLLSLIFAKRGQISTLYGSDFHDADGNRFTPGDFS